MYLCRYFTLDPNYGDFEQLVMDVTVGSVKTVADCGKVELKVQTDGLGHRLQKLRPRGNDEANL